MDFDITQHAIFLTIHGSHAYGMARPESDVDVKGIAIPPAPYFHGYLKHFEQFEGDLPRTRMYTDGGYPLNMKLSDMTGRQIPLSEKIDSVVYDIRKFFKLAADCNPNIIEVLFGDESGHILTTDASRSLIAHRKLFLSAKAKFTFSGYAFSQLKRIKTHRRWLLNPPKKKPERADYGLPERTVIPNDQLKAAESLIRRKVEEWIFLDDDLPREVLDSVRRQTIHALRDIWAALAADCYVLENGIYKPFVAPADEFDDPDMDRIEHAAGKMLGYDANFLELLDRERHYRGAIKQWRQYQDWKKNRNPARAELEMRFGYDTKHAAHLKRLLDMAKEIMTDGKVIVKRPNAEELLAIREHGIWDYDRLIEWAEHRQRELEDLYEAGDSPLPKKPNHAALDDLCRRLVEIALGRKS